MIWTWQFWKDAIERAIRAAANTTAGIITVNSVPALPGHIDDVRSIGVAALAAAIASLLFSVGASGATGSPNASLVNVKGDVPPAGGNPMKP